MACRTMPWFECRDGIFEIDEFDCTEIFVVVGEEKALVIDTGTGIGDLKGLIEEKITKKPYIVAASHNHGDHIGGAGWFSPIYIHPADKNMAHSDAFPTLEFRKNYARIITERENKCYAYDPELDIRPWPRTPEFIPMEDGHVFDLGGRRVTAYHCPGHTPGEMVFLDDKTRTLLCGDAFNCNWLLNRSIASTPKESARIALAAMERIASLGDRYDSVFNFHHDFRGFGQPLASDVIPNLIACLRQLLAGQASFRQEADGLNPGKTKTVAYFGNVFISCMGQDIWEAFGPEEKTGEARP